MSSETRCNIKKSSRRIIFAKLVNQRPAFLKFAEVGIIRYNAEKLYICTVYNIYDSGTRAFFYGCRIKPVYDKTPVLNAEFVQHDVCPFGSPDRSGLVRGNNQSPVGYFSYGRQR